MSKYKFFRNPHALKRDQFFKNRYNTDSQANEVEEGILYDEDNTQSGEDLTSPKKSFSTNTLDFNKKKKNPSYKFTQSHDPNLGDLPVISQQEDANTEESNAKKSNSIQSQNLDENNRKANEVTVNYFINFHIKIKNIIKKRNGSVVKDDAESVNNRKRKWLIYGGLALLILACSLGGVFLGIPALIGYGVMGAGLMFAANYAYHSTDRAKTLGRMIAFGLTAATVALLVNHVMTTLDAMSVMENWGLTLAPIAVCAGIAATASFLANMVLYCNDVPGVLDKIKAWWDNDNKLGWPKENSKHYYRDCAYKVISLGYDAVNIAVSLATGYLLTASMTYSFSLLLTMFLGATLATQPYLLVPVFLIAFVGNSAFMKRGIDAIKQHIINGWNYKGTYIDKQGVNQGTKWTPEFIKEFKTYNPVRKKIFQLFCYFTGYKPGEGFGWMFLKGLAGLVKLGSCGVIAYFSQVPMVKALMSGATWAANFILLKPLMYMHMLYGMKIASWIGRIGITVEKVANVLWTKILQPIGSKIYNKIFGANTENKPSKGLINTNYQQLSEEKDLEFQGNSNNVSQKGNTAYEQRSFLEKAKFKWKWSYRLNMIDRDEKYILQKEIESIFKNKNGQEFVDKNKEEIVRTALEFFDTEGEYQKQRYKWYHPKRIWAALKTFTEMFVKSPVVMGLAVIINGIDNGVLTLDGAAGIKPIDTGQPHFDNLEPSHISAIDYVDGTANMFASDGINGNGYIEMREKTQKEFYKPLFEIPKEYDENYKNPQHTAYDENSSDSEVNFKNQN